MTFFSTVRVTAVTVWNGCPQALTSLSFRFENSANFLACITGVPFVEQILERCQLVIIAEQRVVIIVDSDIPDTISRKYELGVVADLDIISAETG